MCGARWWATYRITTNACDDYARALFHARWPAPRRRQRRLQYVGESLERTAKCHIRSYRSSTFSLSVIIVRTVLCIVLIPSSVSVRSMDRYAMR